METGVGGGTDSIRHDRKRMLLAGVCSAALAIGCSLVVPAAAETYYVSNAGQLRDAITTANGDGDPSSTILMTTDFAVDSVGLPAASKPVTIDTNGHVLSTAGNNNIAFTGVGGGAANTLEGTITGAAGATTGVIGVRGGASVINNATIQGGTNSAGTGGLGVDFGGPPAGLSTFVNNGIIRGGQGSTVGGIGIFVRAGTNPLVNTGTIEGGNGASAIVTNGASVGLTLINSGTISAGAGQADAIRVTGTSGVLSVELRAGSVIEGNVLANATLATDTLRLGGDEDEVFDASTIGDAAQYQNFNNFEELGASTWTLTGTSTALTPWLLSDGTLAVSSDGALGDVAGALTIGGGSLRALSSFESTRDIIFTGVGGIEVDAGAVLALSGALTGTGRLRKLGEGTLIQNSARGYDGLTWVQDGT